MALNAAQQLEVRTTGSDTNSGGFKAGASGTDWSQQDSPQYSVTDGVTAGTTTIISATAAFGTDVVGNLIYVQGGTGSVTAGWYEIVSRTNATTIVVDRSTGLTAGTGVTLHIGGCFLTLAAACAICPSQGIIWIKKGAYSVTAVTTLNSGNSIGNARPTQIRGYNATHGDNPAAADQPVITAASGSGYNVLSISDNNCMIANLVVDCNGVANTGIINTGSNVDRGSKIFNCTVKNFLVYGILTFQTVVNCYVTGGQSGATGGFGLSSIYIGCRASANACPGWFTSGGTYFKCISDNNTGASSDGWVYRPADSGWISNTTFFSCVAYNNGRDGIRAGSTYQTVNAISCIIALNSGKGITGGFTQPVATPQFGFNAFYSNSGGSDQSGAGDVTLTGDPFVNGAAGDFTLNSTAGAGAACKAVGILGALIGGTNISYDDIGAMQHQDSGGPVGKITGARSIGTY